MDWWNSTRRKKKEKEVEVKSEKRQKVQNSRVSYYYFYNEICIYENKVRISFSETFSSLFNPLFFCDSEPRRVKVGPDSTLMIYSQG